jgi:hypothetical protein
MDLNIKIVKKCVFILPEAEFSGLLSDFSIFDLRKIPRWIRRHII